MTRGDMLVLFSLFLWAAGGIILLVVYWPWK